MSSSDEDILSAYAVGTGRKLFLLSELDEYEKHGQSHTSTPREVPPGYANLISSEMLGGTHMPVIDCDFPIQAVPSSTPGNYHLYIDRELTWPQYRALLDGFHKAGLIQDAWYANAIREGRSYVRLPHIKKAS